MPPDNVSDSNLGRSAESSIESREAAQPRLQPIEPSGDTDPFDIALSTEEQPSSERASRPGLIWEITETLVLALFIFVAVRSVVLNFRVDGLSMEPNLDSGQMLLVNRQIYFHFDANALLNVLPFVEREGQNIIFPLHPPQRGDIVVFDPPVNGTTKPYIKRVIGLPGERITIHDGQVFVNGEPLDEPYIEGTSTMWPNGDPGRELVVPENYLFVLGDNRNNSTDSRTFGPVSMDAVIGKAWISYWPADLAGIMQTPLYSH